MNSEDEINLNIIKNFKLMIFLKKILKFMVI